MYIFHAFELWTLYTRTNYIFVMSMTRKYRSGYSFFKKINNLIFAKLNLTLPRYGNKYLTLPLGHRFYTPKGDLF